MISTKREREMTKTHSKTIKLVINEIAYNKSLTRLLNEEQILLIKKGILTLEEKISIEHQAEFLYYLARWLSNQEYMTLTQRFLIFDIILKATTTTTTALIALDKIRRHHHHHHHHHQDIID